MTINDFFMDFSWASSLILLGLFLRTRFKFFQKFFIPPSMIAGFLGLVLGPEVLNIIKFSPAISSYPGLLIILVFTILGLNGFELGQGQEGLEDRKRLMNFQIYRVLADFIQFILPILFTILVLSRIYPGLNPAFGILMAAGFTGGHGTVAALGEKLAALGWPDGQDVAMTFATIGMVLGVFGGILLIRLASKKGLTNYMEDFDSLGPDLQTGLVAPENRKPLGYETISPVSLDSLGFHLALVLAISGLSLRLNTWLGANLIQGIPSFTLAYLLSLIFFMVFRKRPIYKYIDRGINSKISGASTDFLVFFGMASIKLSVVLNYLGPLVLMTLLGILILLFTIYPLGKIFNDRDWFERSIFVYGYSSGVLAIGLILLRIVDPNQESKTLEDTALTPFTNIFEIFSWSVFPGLLISGRWYLVLLILGLIILSFLVVAKKSQLLYPSLTRRRFRKLGTGREG